MNFLKIPNKRGDKIIFYYDLGRGKGQRPSTGIFIFKQPKNQVEKNHNKEALRLLEIKKSKANVEPQAIGTPFIPKHKFKANFTGAGQYQDFFVHELNYHSIQTDEEYREKARQWSLWLLLQSREW